MASRFEGSLAVVTGGAAGIGAATCRRLAREGAHIVVVDRDEAAAAETVAELPGAGHEQAVVDVADESAIEGLAARLEATHGRVDVLVNNAAIRVDPSPLGEIPESDWEEILAVNLKGVVTCSKALLPLMGGGAVVNVASIGARGARPGWSAYDATKGAVLSLTRDMACDYIDDGIRVNAISPGWVITDYHLDGMDPGEADRFYAEKTTPGGAEGTIMKRAGKPAEIAAAIAFLASPDASFITGIELPVDGGYPVL